MSSTSHSLAHLLVVPLLAMVITASAGEVYRWKDARGVTHYGDSPPPAARSVRSVAGSKAPRPVVTAVTSTEHPQCVTARNNLALLKGKAPVGIDNDKDGKPDAAMDDAERARQANLAQAGVDAYCKTTPVAPKA